MNKRKAHHVWTKIRWIKPWYFLALALISGVVGVFALRANNLHMVELREAVYSADEQGADVQTPLKELQSYVTSHMNTNLSAGNSVYPPIQLEHTYERHKRAQVEAAANGNVLYTEAQRHCETQNSADFSGRNRVPCIEEYVEARSAGSIKPIDPALYQFAFVSPVWSPDLAGWSLVCACLSFVLFLATWAFYKWVRN